MPVRASDPPARFDSFYTNVFRRGENFFDGRSRDPQRLSATKFAALLAVVGRVRFFIFDSNASRRTIASRG